MHISQRLILRLIDCWNWTIVIESLYTTSWIIHATSQWICRTDIICLYRILLISCINTRRIIEKADSRDSRPPNNNQQDQCNKFFHELFYKVNNTYYYKQNFEKTLFSPRKTPISSKNTKTSMILFYCFLKPLFHPLRSHYFHGFGKIWRRLW